MPLQNARLVELPLRHPWRIARGAIAATPNVLVEIEWGGATGHGLAAPSRRHGENADTVLETLPRLAPVVAGDPRAYRSLAADLAHALPGHGAAKSAVDMALHDLAGKLLGAPVHRLLGIDPARMPVTSYSIGIDTPEVVVEKVREADPYPILKVKLGSPDDRVLFEAVRSATDKVVRVDANEGWKTPAEALAMIEWLAARGVELIEQPLPAADEDGMRWLKARSPLPLVADEAMLDAAIVPRLAGAYHGVNVKLGKCGGLAAAMEAIAVARAHGLKIMIGCMVESSLGIAAAAQLAPLCDWVDLDGNLLLAEDPFIGHPVERGTIRLHDTPGLGAGVR
jgi:L-Ala-D/L-Glu epimerase